MLSSNFIDERHLERIRREVSENNGGVTEATIESIHPNDLFEKFGISDIDFLSIDTEGCELPILQNIDFGKHPVKCICVENGSRSSQIFQFLTSLNFRLAMCVGCGLLGPCSQHVSGIYHLEVDLLNRKFVGHQNFRSGFRDQDVMFVVDRP